MTMINRAPNVALVALVALCLRWCVSVHPYSGQGKPPMFGDYEAQRHWQEVTVNLPLSEWYANTTNNDLQYWGLDYPPLTAYHSLACGMVAQHINPDYVALFSSRGYESPAHKLFMRYTVLVADLLVYFPAAWFLMRALSGRRSSSYQEYLCLLLYPGLYLVDHGHFQYNAVSLGLFVSAVAALCVGRDCVGTVLFCLALNYKQMELYHALPFFFYLLGVCLRQGGLFGCVWKLIKVAFCVAFTFSAVWLPFASDPAVLTQVVRRLFPIDRGLYEDKVASIWCSLNVVIKLKDNLDTQTMALVCLLATAVGVLPSCLHLFSRPTSRHFRYSLLNVSLIFFLLSYHVHEKTILLAAIPACLLISEEPFMVSWFLTVSTASLLPLMVKDGLLVPYLALSALFITIAHYYFLPVHHRRGRVWWWMYVTYYLSIAGIMFLSLLELVVTPPVKLPDLFPVELAIYCSGHFIFFCLYFHYCQFSLKYSPDGTTRSTTSVHHHKQKAD